MDPLKGKETQQKQRPLCAETSSNSKDSKSHASAPVAGCSFWYDGYKTHDQIKNRDQNTKDGDSANKLQGKAKENASETMKDQFANQSYQSYGYGNSADQNYMNSSAAMMSMYSAYGPMTTMNPQWTMNPLDSMNMSTGMNVCPTIDMSGNQAAGINPYAYMSMSTDPNVYGMMGMANYGGYGMMGNDPTMMGPVKEIIHLSLSSLYPPNPTAPPPSTRPKPLGCKTVFVGGLPENTTEEIMKEIFQSVGEICTVRMSKKNFCHIRFKEEASVDSAVYYSGYRLKVSNKDDAGNTGRLHVDFAQARDDQYEYECRQRALQREARHRERLEQELYRPPTPPPVVYYTDHEASILGEKLRNEEKYQQAIFVLVTWLDRGECNRRNAGYFYSMIQSTNSHVRRLMNEKKKFEDELNKAKVMLKQQMHGILLQFHDIDKVFNAASLQKVWDHFTKAQRKNIDLWKKQTAEIKNAHVQEVLNDRVEDEMDLSEDEAEDVKEDTENKTPKSDIKSVPSKELEKLKEENDSLRCQLLASENELAVLALDIQKEKDSKEAELQSVRDTFGNCYRGIWKKRMRDAPETKEAPPSKLRKCDEENKDGGESSHKNDTKSIKDNSGSEFPLSKGSEKSKNPNASSVSPADVRYIGLISTFLNVHPFGASVDYICSYLHQIDSTVHARDIEILMKKFPSIFKEESTGIGASLEKKWSFCGFNPQK